MSGPIVSRIAGARVLRRLPAARLLAAAELIVLARQHISKLEPHERRRVLELLRDSRGRPRRLSLRDRRELQRLIAKAEPKLFMGNAMHKLTGVPMPSGARRGSRNKS